MTNETQKKFVMIVDDKGENREAALKAVRYNGFQCSPEYGVVDLQEARAIFEGKSRDIAVRQYPNVVLTDFHFYERGSGGDVREYLTLQNAEIIEKRLRNSPLLKKLASLCPRSLYKENSQTDSEEFWIHDTINSRYPPNGYFVMQECEKRNIPYAVVTSLGHGMGGLLLLAEGGIIPEEELLSRFKIYEKSVGMDDSLYGPIQNSRVVLTKHEKTEKNWTDALNIALKAGSAA